VSYTLEEKNAIFPRGVIAAFPVLRLPFQAMEPEHKLAQNHLPFSEQEAS